MHKLIKKYQAGGTGNVGAIQLMSIPPAQIAPKPSFLEENPIANFKPIPFQQLPEKSSFFGNIFKGLGSAFKGTEGTSGLVSMAANIGQSFLPKRITSKGTDAVNGALDIASSIPGPVGMYATAAKFAFNALDSLGGSNLATTHNDYDTQDTLSRIGGGYGSFQSDWDAASTLSGQRAGLFTSKSSLNNQIYDANKQMAILGGIMNKQRTNDLLTAQMGDRWNERTMVDMNGGFGNLLSAQKGLKLTRQNVAMARRVKRSAQKTAKRPFAEWVQKVNPDFISDDYDLEKAYNELPMEQLETWRKDTLKPENEREGVHLGDKYKKPSHMTYSFPGYGWSGSDEQGWTFTISPEQFEMHGGNEGAWDKYVQYWNKNEPNAKLKTWNGTLTYQVPHMEEFARKVQPNIKEQTNSLYVQKPPIFKEGGSVNIIPEGSLHARLHHMENAEGLTKKGIPVVSIAEGGQMEQQAEIELNEIIFRLETTKELEKLMEDGSDNAAIEAGKLLVKEIFEKTDDRTGLIKSLEPEKKEPSVEERVKNHQVFKDGGILEKINKLSEEQLDKLYELLNTKEND